MVRDDNEESGWRKVADSPGSSGLGADGTPTGAADGTVAVTDDGEEADMDGENCDME